MSKNVTVPLGQLEADIRDGTIDTVLAVFGDHQGRLIGKRTDGEFFLDLRARGGHRELRLPHRLRPRQHPAARVPLGELRPGLRRHARRRRPVDDPLRAVDRDDRAGDRRPRRRRLRRAGRRCRPGAMLQQQVGGRRRLGVHARSWAARSSSSCSRRATTRPTPLATATLTPNSPYLEDYHILQTTKEEAVLGAMRRGLTRRRPARRVLQG